MKLDKEKFRCREVVVNVKHIERKEFLKAVENEGIRWQDGTAARIEDHLPESYIYIRFINDDITDISKFTMVYGTNLYNQLTVDDVTIQEESIDESVRKYRVIESISPLLVLEKDPCKTEFNKFVKKYDFYKIIIWTKEVEDYMMKQNGWIEWLIENNFIKENKIEIEYDEDKVYIIKSEDVLYKLTGVKDVFMFASLDETYQGLNGCEDSPQKILNECLNEGKLIYTYNNTYEAIKDHPSTKK